MLKLLFGVCLALSLLFSVSGDTTNSEAKTKTPLLYYYSDNEEGFVIERADGSETRILTEFSVSPNNNDQDYDFIVTGPGWSPSGNKFAWRETTAYGGISPAYIFDVESGNKVSVLDGVPIAKMTWSPTQDLLLVSTRESVFVVDTENIQSPVQVNDGISENLGAVNYLDWTPSGDFIIQYSLDGLFSTMEVISLDGNRTSRQFYSADRRCFIPSWSSNDQVLYVNSDQDMLIFEDFQNGDLTEFDLPSGIIHRIDWSPDNQHALLYVADECSQFSASEMTLYLLSINTGETEKIADGVQIPFNTSFPYQYINFADWSPTGEYVAFQLNDRTLQVASIPSLQITELSPSAATYYTHLTWLKDGKLAFLQRSSQESFNDIYLFDPNDGSHHALLSEANTAPAGTIWDFVFSEF